MGNMVTAVHDVACSHTNHTSLWRSLLPDRLAKPTAEMVEAWLYLQDQTLQLKELGESDLSVASQSGDITLLLSLAKGYCALFVKREGRQGEPSDALSEFSCALRKPDDFLDNLLKWRAQALPTKQVAKLKPLSHLAGGLPGTFRGRFAETLSQLAVYLRASCECAEIYAEIRELLAAGEMKPQEAEVWLEGTDSDQGSMIKALGGRHDSCEDREFVYAAVAPSSTPLLKAGDIVDTTFRHERGL